MDMMKEQIEIEARMADRGIARYQRIASEALQDGEATRSKSIQTVLDSAIISVSEAIEQFVAAASSGRAGRRHTAVKRLAGINPSEAAFVALRIILDGMAKDAPLTPVAVQIGRTLELEARMKKLEKEHSGYVRESLKNLNSRTGHIGHRRAVLNMMLREKEEGWERWGERDLLVTGIKLVELVVESTGLFEVRMDQIGKKRIMTIHATERFKDWLHSLDTRFALMAPEYLPCVVPPKDWTGFDGGGYHTDALAYPPTLVKTSSKAHRRALGKANLGGVLEAVNAIQRTPWAINSRVLEVVEEIVTSGRTLGGLPAMDAIPLPARPLDIDTNEEALKQWKREAARTYEENRRVSGRRVNMLRAVQVATEFEEYPAIYFPHQLDFRGRVYPIPQGLNPQGNDLAKGLLHFAEGDPLDNELAVRWFEIHGANCFGVDKVSFEDRREWVSQNAENIFRSADDPLGFQWWADADSPFCFLAWCFEYRDWADGGCAREFVSRIPVAMDGSCNGLQHYSAMLRDPRGGAATNLVPADKPQDIYGEVAKVVMRNLARIVAEDRTALVTPTEEERAAADMARRWLDYGIDRNITKRPVMVLPYGGTQRSCFDYTYDAVRERGGYPFKDEELHKATVFLGGVVWSAICEVVVAARLAKGWLKAVASRVSNEGLPLLWTTPVGFPVVQAYPEVTDELVKTSLFGERFRPTLTVVKPGSINKRRQANGVAPNFVHSLDASALIDTVLRAKARGVTKFAMIHDSYGTTAGRTAELSGALRDAFVEMYERNDVLKQFLNSVVPDEIKGELPSAPTVGGLDLKLVKESPYFFA